MNTDDNTKPDDSKKEELTGQELDDFKRGLKGQDDEGLISSRSKENLEGLKQHEIDEKHKEDAEEEKKEAKEDVNDD